jgi:hypothetical protein
MKPYEMKEFPAFDDETGEENNLKDNDVGFKKRVLLRVGRHLVHSLSSSEPE